MKPFIGITWSVSNRHGWGIYGLNLVLETVNSGKPWPICLEELSLETISEENLKILEPIKKFQLETLPQMFRKDQMGTLKDTIVLHSMGNNLELGRLSQRFHGEANVGIAFFENSTINPDKIENAQKLDCIITGSSWNAKILKEAGLKNIKTVFQGVNTRLFKPLPKTGKYADKFTIFSGGKLEFRKSQDIVLEAFKLFSKQHDDAILVTAWHNLWAHHGTNLEHSPHTKSAPKIDPEGNLLITEWAVDHGINSEKFVDLGIPGNHMMPQHLRDMDLAIFPNRCEGGTNLVAMEAMACGVPCIISENTGQVDLIKTEHCYRLPAKGAVNFPGCGTKGWGESSIDDILELMEKAYQKRKETMEKGLMGAEFIHQWSWKNQISKLLERLDKF